MSKSKRDYRKIIVFILLTLVLLLLLKETAIMILLFPVGIFLGYYTAMFGKVIPHVAPETMTIMCIFSGLAFGSKFGFFYGLSISLLVYSLLGLIKLTTLLNSLVIASGGLYAGILMSFGLSLELVFIFSLLLRTLTGILIFWNLTSDKIEALTHAIIDPIFNMAIYMPIFIFLYNILI